MNPLFDILKREYPLCHIFELSDDDIVFYDAKADFAFLVTESEAFLLMEWLSGSLSDREISPQHAAKISYYETLRRAGVFLPGPLKQVSTEDYEQLYKKVLYFDENVLQRKYVLEATEDCNFRCSYCFNTQREGSSLRAHSRKKMSFEIAKKSMDHYFAQYIKVFRKLSGEKKEKLLTVSPPTLAWYGGETMMNFSLLETATAYFKSLPWEEEGIPAGNLNFSANTNMSIMPDRAIRFFVENRYQLYASLDGPESENDKCRVFENGKGTYSTVVRNLRRIRDYDPEYFKEKIIILSVESPLYDKEKCEQFFKEGEFSSLQWMPNQEEKEDCLYEFPKKVLQIIKSSSELEILKYKRDIDNYVSGIFNDNLLSLIKYSDIKFDNPSGSDYLDLFLTCPMGIDNNMIGVDGQVHICHKTDGSYPFANIRSLPLDYSALARIYQQYNHVVNQGGCKSCWAVRYCDVCGVKRLHGGKFVNPRPMECEVIREEKHIAMSALMYSAMQRPDLIRDLQKRKTEHYEYISIIDVNSF